MLALSYVVSSVVVVSGLYLRYARSSKDHVILGGKIWNIGGVDGLLYEDGGHTWQ